MEAAPRLPMISFELKISTEPVSFATKLKQYIASFYREDPEAYNKEIHILEQLRGGAVRPLISVAGVQTIKKYYCQLKFLRSRFPMEKGAQCAVTFSWKDTYAGVVCSAADIDLELMSILYNVGALHSQLGASNGRQTPEGMKMACTHFQCAAWAFKEAREVYPQAVAASLAHEVLHFMEIVCLAQAQECILDKSMSDNRKCTIIAKVAAQAVSYYDQAGLVLSCQPEGAASEVTDIIGSRVVKDWCRYIKFKAAYHNCISLLYQGQHCEEQQKMGERCALYQAAADKLEEARKLASGRIAAVTNSPLSTSTSDIEEALGFTLDVVEGKRKAAKNENEFIYHESVPEKDTLPLLQGASLVRLIPFGVNDPDVSGPDIFARLVPMEAHEASSIYSERKAELLRRTGSAVEERDRELDEFMSSLHQIDILLERLTQPQIIPQEIVDRAAALNARPQAVQALVEAMGKLSTVHIDVDSLLNEANTLIETEKEASSAADRRQVVSMPINDLSREAAKYREALSKASESNEALHRAMSAHVANLKVLAQPLAAVDRHLPKVSLNDEDRPALDDLKKLIEKVDEMRLQRSQLLGQLREAARLDDITARLAVNRNHSPAEMDSLFDTELAKHRPQVALIEQNLSAQQNILLALTDAYAKLSGCRKQIVEAFRRRDQIISALIASYDAYEDLLAKANKGIDFYQKLETNVNKLLQRLRSTCRVQEEEREQKNASIAPQINTPIQNNITPAPTPKLRDYLQQPVGVRPAPLGSEHTEIGKPIDLRNPLYATTQYPTQNYPIPPQYQIPRASTPSYIPNSIPLNYQHPNISRGYQISSTMTTSQSLPSPVSEPPSPISKPQSFHGPQVTPAMPQYQVAPSQYPPQNLPQYQNYGTPTPNPTSYMTKSASQNYQQYQVPQSPTVSQPYPIRSTTPQGYQTGTVPQYPNMGYPGQNPQVSVGYSTGRNQDMNSYSTIGTPQQTSVPNQQLSGQYPNTGLGQFPNRTMQPPTANIQNPTGILQTPPGTDQKLPGIPQNSSGITQNQNIRQPNPAVNPMPQGVNPANLEQYQSPGTIPNPNIGLLQYAGQYPNTKLPGYLHGQINPGMMQYPTPGMSGNQPGGVPPPGYNSQMNQVQPKPDLGNPNVGQYPNVQSSGPNQISGTPGYPNPQMVQNQNIPPGIGQGSHLSAFSQYPQSSAGLPKTPNINQLATGIQNIKIEPNTMQYQTPQTNPNIGQYPNVGTPQPAQYNSQISPGISNYPTSNSNAASPQHQNNNSPQNYPKTQTNITSPQHYSIPQTGVPPQGGILPNQQIRPASPYQAGQNYPVQGNSQYPGYQSGSNQNLTQLPQYSQGNQYQRPMGPYQQNKVGYSTPIPNQSPYYPAGTPGYYPQGAPQNVVPSTTSYPAAQQPQQIQNTIPKQDSNIDLLAGLDFNVSQVPLDPVKAPLHDSKNDNESEKDSTTTDQTNYVEQKEETVVYQNPDRWKKENSFELDVNNLDSWVHNNMEHELEIRWKLHQKENDITNAVTSVARCYPSRNRCPDSLPYDRNRFELPCPPATDDYINASKVKLINLPPVIITQAPLPSTIQHFWTMLVHSGTDLIICLMTDADLQNAGLNEGYWQPEFGIQIRSIKLGEYWTERTFCVGGRDVSHIQLTTPWSTIGLGNIITGLSELAIEVVGRRKVSSIIIQCLTGIGRSGVMAVLLEVASELLPIEGAPILVDVLDKASKLSEFRRNPLRDRLHLEFAYRSVLKMARTILPAPVIENQTTPEEVTPQPTENKDPLEDLDPLWKLKVT